LKNIKIGTLNTTIGHIVLNTALYFEKSTSFTIIVNLRNDIKNIALYDTLKLKYQKDKKALYLTGYGYVLLYRLINKISRHIPFICKFISNIDCIHRNATYEYGYGSSYKFWNKDTFDNFGPFNVPTDSFSKFDEWKKINGVNGKFVCIFVRDDSYWNDENKFVENTRNSSIEKLIPTIDYLINKGYWVIRIGRSHNDSYSKLNFNSDMYVDYSTSKKISDEIDIMLIKECELFVGSNSGISNVQLLFNTKMILLNWSPAGLGPPYLNCQYILKKYIKNGKVIPFNSIKKDILLCEDIEVLKSNGYTLEENNAEEIKELIYNTVTNNQISSTDQSNYSFIITKGRSTINQKWIDDNSELFC
jgi:putative glycosyltransferase (TIGR04372 family)